MPSPIHCQHAARRPAVLVVFILSMLLTAACGPGADEADALPAAAPTLPEPTGDPEDMTGSWWALSRDTPYRAFRIELTPTEDPDAWTGTWLTFSWRGSQHAETLSHPSLPVAIHARIELQDVIITGPAPQFDDTGTPNGDTGRWELRVHRVSPAGKPAAYAGVMVHPEDTPTHGTAVKFTRTFENWPG
jgi:hypothetical protein